MTDSFAEDVFAPTRLGDTSGAVAAAPPLAARYGLSLLLVAVATVLAFVVQHLIAAPNLTLVYVLPVVLAATFLGWGPSVLAVVASVAAFDFFFTAPYFSFAIANPSDIWAAALLFVVAAIVTAVAAQSRRRTVEARLAGEQARALQALAHVVITSRPRRDVLEAAALTLHRIFGAPIAIFMQEGQRFGAVATAGDPMISQADEDAAKEVLSMKIPSRGETYPYDRTPFDFWPVETPAGCRCVLGVDFVHADRERPVAPERFVEVVAAYVATALPK